MLEDLMSVAPPQFRPALRHELYLLHEVARQHFPDVESVDTRGTIEG
jgi:hypothetical protein